MVEGNRVAQPVMLKERIIPSPSKGKPSREKRLFLHCVKELEAALLSRDPKARREALEKLASLNVPAHEGVDNLNLHTHTSYSYHFAGWTPSRFAWEARQAGLYAAGMIDFDVLDGAEEFLDACELLALRGTAGIEVRGFLKEFATSVIDSPGEPGVHYIAGSGMVRKPAPGGREAAFLEHLRKTAEDRNRALVERINVGVPDIALDYDRDVLPLTGGGNATERHIITAYVESSRRAFPDPVKWRAWWSALLGVSPEAMADLGRKRPELEEKVRSKLAKRGGIGYRQPDETSFPLIGEIYSWVKASGGVPMDSWLDGTSEGESRMRELFECNRSLGAMAINFIPDRNWNVSKPEEKKIKLANFAAIVAMARERHMPIHIGTEGNKAGLPFVDDLAGPDLAPFKADFVAGARVLIGHAVLARFAGFSYSGPEADTEFGADIKARNAFFGAVGALPPLDGKTAWYLRQVGPAKALEALRNSARRGRWSVA